MTAVPWPAVTDEDMVERLIPAIQRAIVSVGAADQGTRVGVDVTSIVGPDVANALLMILATLLEQSPVCATPRGIRQIGEAAGRELAQLIRDTRGLTTATMN